MKASLAVWFTLFSAKLVAKAETCESVELGYQCTSEISHYWGQYSPYFNVESSISSQIPCDCEITFVQVLARHGARDPTASKSKSYNQTIRGLKTNVTHYGGKYSFLANYTYSLGADQLTLFGEQQMIDAGIQFFHRYSALASKNVPFSRSSSEARVVESAQNWTQGFLQGRGKEVEIPIVVISEDAGSNNTLNHGLCTNFEDGPISEIGDEAQQTFAKSFVPGIQKRLNTDLPGASLTSEQTIYLMDLCSFETVASLAGDVLSPFCGLFTEAEWHSYNYYETLGKFYGYGKGNPLGPTQGVGFVNELIARMTNSPVRDQTSTNRSLDNNPGTFPLNKKLYADFSHDNDITAILSALGLFNTTQFLSNTTITEADSAIAAGYSAAWTVPFAARVYIEKMRCKKRKEELVRVILNGRVVPLICCGADELGRCTLDTFIASQGFASSNGQWSKCFS